MERISRQKIKKARVVLNDTIDQLDLIDIYKTLHFKTAEYTFFSSAHGTFSRIDNMLGHKTSPNKLKRTEITSSIFFWPQWHETGNQLQKEKWKNKHVETKQHTTKTPMGQWRNQSVSQKIPWNKWSENTILQNLWDAIKAVLRAKFIVM